MAGPSFEEWATARAPALLRFGYLVTGSTDAAEDAVGGEGVDRRPVEAGGDAADSARRRHERGRLAGDGAQVCVLRAGDVECRAQLADLALAMLDVDPHGLDVMDRKLIEAVIHRFDGGPVGLDNVAAAIGEERDTIEDVLEPFLIQQGFLQRTSRGRIATALSS